MNRASSKTWFRMFSHSLNLQSLNSKQSECSCDQFNKSMLFKTTGPNENLAIIQIKSAISTMAETFVLAYNNWHSLATITKDMDSAVS